MLRAISWLVKASVFALIVLIVGNTFKVGNKTINDQVKTQLSHAERVEVVGEVKDWARQITSDQKAGIEKKINAQRTRAIANNGANEARANAHPRIAPRVNGKQYELRSTQTASEEIPSSERQKLRALMRELNTARDSN